MKKSRTFICGLLCLSIYACNKPPASPDFRQKTAAGRSDSSADSDPERPLGKELEGGTKADSYTNLVCDKPETHRGLRAWRRLSNVEIINTAKDVFAIPDSVDTSSLISDIPKVDIFDTVQAPENFMEGNRLKGYVSFAENVSAGLALTKFFPCMAEGVACVTKQINSVGALAWRRPLAPEEPALFVNLYKTLMLDGVQPEAGFRSIIQALILSPNFMYRSELGKANESGEYELTSWEIASALSYLIWRRPPDERLRDLASKDGLNTTAAIAGEATRMLADPRAKTGMADFASMWFDSQRIVNFAKVEPAFTEGVKKSLGEEAKKMFVSTMYSPKDATFKTLLTSNYTYGDQSTAFIYGSAPAADGTLPYTQPERLGVLGQGSFLASHAYADSPNPITRGAFISERLLCVGFGKVPMTPIPEQKAGISNKERFRLHSSAPACAVCHKMLDPLGFAMENFDTSGVFRSTDAGQPVAVSSTFTLDSRDVAVTSPQALSTAIGSSRQGLECYVRQSFRYAFGRMEFSKREILGFNIPEHKDTVQSNLDQCQITAVTDAMVKNGGQLQSAFVQLVSSPAFRLRLIGQLPTENLGFTGGEH